MVYIWFLHWQYSPRLQQKTIRFKYGFACRRKSQHEQLPQTKWWLSAIFWLGYNLTFFIFSMIIFLQKGIWLTHEFPAWKRRPTSTTSATSKTIISAIMKPHDNEHLFRFFNGSIHTRLLLKPTCLKHGFTSTRKN